MSKIDLKLTESSEYMDTIVKLRKVLSNEAKRKFYILFFLMIFAAVFETIGIGLIAPFVGLVANPEVIYSNEILFSIYSFFGFENFSSFFIVMTLGLLSIFILKNVYLLFFFYYKYDIIRDEQVKMSRTLFTSYMKMPYTSHLERNSAELVRNTNIEVQSVFKFIITPALELMTELLVVLGILILLLFISPIPTLISGLFIGGAVALFFRFFRKQMDESGAQQQKTQGQMIKSVNQGLGAIKEVKVSGTEKFFIDTFTKQSKMYEKASRFFSVIQEVPRLFIETMVVATVLLVVLLLMIQSQEITDFLTTLSLFAVAAFRIMPSINKITRNLTTIRNKKPALDVIYADLMEEDSESSTELVETPAQEDNHLSEKNFHESIKIENVSYTYPNSGGTTLTDISLTLPIGHSIAFVGATGAGKTTLIDLILGILSPTDGTIKADGKEMTSIKQLWNNSIGYIPQTIYLSDDTILRNVAFGIEDDKIDRQAVMRAVEQANLDKFIDSLPNKLETTVGESGVRLSGGQRQRIGIARALYHNPEILFMDEATSALDNQTEKEVMKAIDSLKGQKTLMIIAHRLSTIEKCDMIVELDDGKVKEIAHNSSQYLEAVT